MKIRTLQTSAFAMLLFLFTDVTISQAVWTQVTSPVSSNLASISFADQYIGFITTGNKILRTTNSGISWVVFDSSFSYTLGKIQFVNQSTGFVANSEYPYLLYKTTNSGVNWVQLSPTAVDYIFLNSLQGWASDGYDRIHFTNDGGNSWDYRITPNHFGPYSVGFGSPNFGISVSWFHDFMHGWEYMYIYRCTDGANFSCTPGGVYGDACAWTRILSQVGGGPDNPLFRKVYLIDGTAGFLFGGTTYMGGNSPDIYRTQDAGASWGGPIGTGTTVKNFDFVDHNTGYGAGTGTIIYTTDCGSTWTNQNVGVSTQINDIYMLNNTTGWACGDLGVILKSGTVPPPPPPIPPIPNLVLPLNNAVGLWLATTLNWTSSTGAAFYSVQTATDAGFTNLIVNDSTVTAIFKDISGLSPLTTYYWRVRAKNAGGTSGWSSVWNFKTKGAGGPVTLYYPANNSVNIPTTSNFNWSRAFDQTSPLEVSYYWLEMVSDTVTNANLFIDSTLVDTTRMVSGMNPNTTYFWRMKAKNEVGWGNFSVRFRFTTAPPIPGVPTLILPVNNATNVPTTYAFKWTKAIDQATHLLISNYWFEMVSDTVTNANLLRDSTLTDTTRTVTGMLTSTTYYWRVKAKNQTGWSSFSGRNKFTTVPPVPAAPALIAPANNSTGVSFTPLMDWTAVAGTSFYRIQISSDSTFATTVFDSSNVILDSLRIPSGRFINNTKYFWRVNATNAGGTGPWSAIWNFRTLILNVSNNQGEVPKAFRLYTNYPNPFNPTTRIKFDLPITSQVSLQIFNVLGETVTELVNEVSLNAGSYEVDWNGSNYASGIYYYRITAGSYTDVKKMVLIK